MIMRFKPISLSLISVQLCGCCEVVGDGRVALVSTLKVICFAPLGKEPAQKIVWNSPESCAVEDAVADCMRLGRP